LLEADLEVAGRILDHALRDERARDGAQSVARLVRSFDPQRAAGLDQVRQADQADAEAESASIPGIAELLPGGHPDLRPDGRVADAPLQLEAAGRVDVPREAGVRVGRRQPGRARVVDHLQAVGGLADVASAGSVGRRADREQGGQGCDQERGAPKAEHLVLSFNQDRLSDQFPLLM
jgi:hypothetical protein